MARANRAPCARAGVREQDRNERCPFVVACRATGSASQGHESRCVAPLRHVQKVSAPPLGRTFALLCIALLVGMIALLSLELVPRARCVAGGDWRTSSDDFRWAGRSVEARARRQFLDDNHAAALAE